MPVIVHLVISSSTAAVLSAAGGAPEVFRMNSDQIQARLDAIRQQPHGLTLWMQALDGQVRVDGNVAGADYRLNMGGVMLRLDRSLALGNGLLNSGVFFSPGGGNARFSGQGIGSSDVRMLAAGVYSAWQHRSGTFVDGQLTVNHVRNTIDARMTGGEKAQGQYGSLGVGLQLRAGVNRFAGSTLLTSYIGMRGLIGAGEHLSLSNGMSARIHDQRLFAGLAGIRISQAFVVYGTTVAALAQQKEDAWREQHS
ncbi:autotransporter outer membrane beta-barrel domain-containing protein [Klebsiella aerogenes]